MVNEEKESALKKLFAAFGRRPFKEQRNVYMRWAEKNKSDVVSNVVNRVLENEDHLPSLAKLIKEAKILLRLQNDLSSPNDFICRYCDGIGFLPYLYEPNDISPIFFTRMMGCKCSIGQLTSGVTNYFDGQEKLQFEDEAKQHPSMNYLEVVDHIKNKRNKELKQIAITDCKLKSAIKEENT